MRQKLAIKRQIHKVSSQSVNIIIRGEQAIIGVTGMFVAIAVFVQVLLRYVFHSPLFGMEEITLIVVTWFYFIGASYSVHKGSYIRADILSVAVKSQLLLQRFEITSLVLSMVAAALCCYLALEYTLWAAAAGAVTPTFMVSRSYSIGAVVIGCGLMALHFLIRIRREVRGILNPPPDSNSMPK